MSTPLLAPAGPVTTGNADGATVTQGLNSLIDKWTEGHGQNTGNGAKP
jgi:hypothetical protein